MSEKTINLQFDGIPMACTVEVDKNGEYVFQTVEKNQDGNPLRMIKFPEGTDLVKAVAAHNEENSAEVILVDETENEIIVTRAHKAAIDELFEAN